LLSVYLNMDESLRHSLVNLRLGGHVCAVTAPNEPLLLHETGDPPGWQGMLLTVVEHPGGVQLVRFGAKLVRIRHEGNRSDDWCMVSRAVAAVADLPLLFAGTSVLCDVFVTSSVVPGSSFALLAQNEEVETDTLNRAILIEVSRCDSEGHAYLNRADTPYPYGGQRPWQGEGLVTEGARVRLGGASEWWALTRDFGGSFPGFRLVQWETELGGFDAELLPIRRARGAGTLLGFFFYGSRHSGLFDMYVFDPQTLKGARLLVEVAPGDSERLLTSAALPVNPLWRTGTESANLDNGDPAVFLVRAHDGLVLSEVATGTLMLGDHKIGLRLLIDQSANNLIRVARSPNLVLGVASGNHGESGMVLVHFSDPAALAWDGARQSLVVFATGSLVKAHYRARRDGWRLIAATRDSLADDAIRLHTQNNRTRARNKARNKANTTNELQRRTTIHLLAGSTAVLAAGLGFHLIRHSGKSMLS
jgi:hypothetical protein